MSLNDIHLPGAVIADLFRNSLVMAAEAPAPQTASVAGYRWLGGNLKKIVLIVQSPDHVFLSEPHLLFVTRMLEACRLNMGDVALLNISGRAISIAELKQQLDPAIILLMGPDPAAIGLPFSIPFFKIQEYDHCRYLYSPGVEALTRDTEESKILKSKLWVCLRKLFEV